MVATPGDTRISLCGGTLFIYNLGTTGLFDILQRARLLCSTSNPLGFWNNSFHHFSCSRSIQIAFYLCDHLIYIVAATSAAACSLLDCYIAYSFNCLEEWRWDTWHSSKPGKLRTWQNLWGFFWERIIAWSTLRYAGHSKPFYSRSLDDATLLFF